MSGAGVAEAFCRRARLWAQSAPEAAKRLRAEVEELRAGRFVLPGSGGRPLFAGAPPRWHENPTPVGDKEWVWVLNRHGHWSKLLRASVLHEDAALRGQVIREWVDWVACCPPPAWDGEERSLRAAFDAPTPWRTLEAGIRMEQSWSEAWLALRDAPEMSDEARAAILRSFAEHGRVLATIPARLWPRADHNHYLTEMSGLLRLALLLPELPEAKAWREQAWRELGRCLFAQFVETGGQIEGCPHYHAVSLRTLAGAVLLGREHGLETPAEWRPRLEGALAYSLHSLRPTGVNVPWGDSDACAAGPAFAALLAARALGRFEEVARMRELVAPAAWAEALAELTWHVEDSTAGLDELSSGGARVLARIHAQPELGQAMLRNGWGNDAASVFVACRTPVNNGHAHIDPAGFDYTAQGRALLVDPGRYTYREGEERYTFKRASWHNTVTIDERDPFAYVDTWSFGPQREGRVVETRETEAWAAALCEQHNFAPVRHRRAVVLFAQSGALLVVDGFDGLSAGQTVQIWFHLDSARVLTRSAGVAETEDAGEANVRVMGPTGLALTALPGLVSEVLDVARASTRLRLSDAGGAARQVYATWILPRAADAKSWPEPPSPDNALMAWLEGHGLDRV